MEDGVPSKRGRADSSPACGGKAEFDDALLGVAGGEIIAGFGLDEKVGEGGKFWIADSTFLVQG